MCWEDTICSWQMICLKHLVEPIAAVLANIQLTSSVVSRTFHFAHCFPSIFCDQQWPKLLHQQQNKYDKYDEIYTYDASPHFSNVIEAANSVSCCLALSRTALLDGCFLG